MMWLVFILIIWIVFSQLIAWMFCGDKANPDQMVELWAAVFLLVPMGIMYGLIYLLNWLCWRMWPIFVDKPNADSVIL